MKLDALTAWLVGLDTDDGAAIEAKVEEVASRFLRGGGVVSPAEWATLDPGTHAALSKMGDEIRAEQATMIAAALVTLAVAGQRDATVKDALEEAVA